MDRFTEAVKVVLGFEGGYVDDPDDRGGKTNYGITEGTLNAAKQAGIVSPETSIFTITKEKAIKIFKVRYWDAVRADELPPPVDLLVFDCAVNHGVGGAGRILQRALNSFRYLPVVVVDGAIGPKTIGAVNRLVELDRQLNDVMPELGPGKLINDLAKTILLERTKFYVDITKRSRAQKKFLFGWMRLRIVDLGERVGVI